MAPAGNIAAFGLVWFASHKSQTLKKYHTQLMVGSGIALIQSLVQGLLPGLSWIFDSSPHVSAPSATSDYEAEDGVDDYEDTGDSADGVGSDEPVGDDEFADMQTGVFSN
jgi:hypothetical protein